jgi:hypothetical protein
LHTDAPTLLAVTRRSPIMASMVDWQAWAAALAVFAPVAEPTL